MTCGNCKYFDREDCHVNPPTVIEEQGYSMGTPIRDIVSVRPVVDNTDLACRHWEKR